MFSSGVKSPLMTRKLQLVKESFALIINCKQCRKRPWNRAAPKNRTTRHWRNTPDRVPVAVRQHKWFNCFVIYGLILLRMPSTERSPIFGPKIWEMSPVPWQELAWQSPPSPVYIGVGRVLGRSSRVQVGTTREIGKENWPTKKDTLQTHGPWRLIQPKSTWWRILLKDMVFLL